MQNLSSERLQNNIDFLRMFAAMCILYTHCFDLLNLDKDETLMKLSSGRFNFSFLGLNIFFVLSGYLITKSLFHSQSFLHFVWKRFLRIQPLLIVVTIITIFLIGPIYNSLSPANYFTQFSTYTYLRNVFPATGIQFNLPGIFSENFHPLQPNGSIWTLIIEERLYILIALLIFLPTIKRRFFLIFILGLNLLYFLNWIGLFSIDYLKSISFYYAIIFLNASGIYLLGIKRSFLKKLIMGIPALLLLAIIFYSKSFEPLLIIISPFLILYLAFLKTPLNKAGKKGDFTYGIYLFAFPVQQMIIARFPEITPFKLLVFTTAIVIPAAILSWHLFEKKMLNYKDYFIKSI